MHSIQPSLFARPDTLLGICEGLAEDFRVNPLWLRLPLTLLLFFNPVAAVGGYLAAGAIVLLSRLLVPNPRLAAAQTASATPAVAQVEPPEADRELETLAA